MPRSAAPMSCYTCRKRKLKCDGALPTCARCEKARLICDRTSRLSIKVATVQSIEASVEGPASSPRDLLRKPHIADLFHIYIKDLASWYDLNDLNCTFAREVAARALDSPLLFASIIAFAACFSARRFSSSLAVAEAYHDKCLRSLIGLSSSDESIRNGTALAATCLLRSYELLSEVVDPNRHLFGGFSLLPSQTPSLHDSSLMAAGFWNWLREELTYCLMNECPLKMNREFAIDTVNANNIANTISLLLARTVNMCFDGEVDQVALQNLQQDIRVSWMPHQPQPFIYHWNQPDDFPTIKCLSDTEVGALHYHKVVQCILDDGNRSTLAAEICGLAMSSMSSAVIVNAFGPICYTGKWLETASQRNALVGWLYDAQKRTAWPVSAIVEKLRSAWDLLELQP